MNKQGRNGKQELVNSYISTLTIANDRFKVDPNKYKEELNTRPDHETDLIFLGYKYGYRACSEHLLKKFKDLKINPKRKSKRN